MARCMLVREQDMLGVVRTLAVHKLGAHKRAVRKHGVHMLAVHNTLVQLASIYQIFLIQRLQLKENSIN